MVSPDSIESLKRILKLQEVPENVLQEVQIRTQMFHRSGASGPLPVLGLIDAVRSLGLAPLPEVVSQAEVDWGRFPNDGSIRVEARFNGAWMPGVYLGFVEHGTLAIRLDGDSFIKECRKHIVRLASQINDFEEEPLTAQQKLVLEEEKENPDIQEPEAEAVEDLPGIDWSKINPGDKFYYEHNDDYLDCEFVRLSGDLVTIKVDGRNRAVGRDKLTFAASAVGG